MRIGKDIGDDEAPRRFVQGEAVPISWYGRLAFRAGAESFVAAILVLVGRESVAEDELDGYRIWAGIDSIEE